MFGGKQQGSACRTDESRKHVHHCCTPVLEVARSTRLLDVDAVAVVRRCERTVGEMEAALLDVGVTRAKVAVAAVRSVAACSCYLLSHRSLIESEAVVVGGF